MLWKEGEMMNKKQWAIEAKSILREIDNETLKEIYYETNRWNWDYHLGRKPIGWDNMPLYHQFGIRRLKTLFKAVRKDYLKPVIDYIHFKIPEYDLLLYCNMRRGVMEKEFKKYWLEERPKFLSL